MLPLVANSEFSKIFSSELSSLMERAATSLETLTQNPRDEAALADALAAYHSMGSMGGMARAVAIEKAGRLFERLIDVASTFSQSDPERALAIFYFSKLHLAVVHEIIGVTLSGRESEAEAEAERLQGEVFAEWGDYYYQALPASLKPAEAGNGSAPPAVADTATSSPYPLDVVAPFPGEAVQQKRTRRIPVEPEPEPLKTPDDDVLEFLAEMDAGFAATPAAESVPPTPPDFLARGAARVQGPQSELDPPSTPFVAPIEPGPVPAVTPRMAAPPPAGLGPRVTPSLDGGSVSPDGSLKFVSASRPVAPTVPPPLAPIEAEPEPHVDLEMLQYFIPETEEYCETMERAIETMERNPSDDDSQQTILRLFHTIKGAANSIGLGHMGDLAHSMEDLYGGLSENRITLPHAQKMQLTSRAVQVVRQCLRRASSTPPVFAAPATLAEVISRIEKAQTTPAEVVPTPALEVVSAPEPVAAPVAEIPVAEIPFHAPLLEPSEEVPSEIAALVPVEAPHHEEVPVAIPVSVPVPPLPAAPAAAPVEVEEVTARLPASTSGEEESFGESLVAARIEPQRLDLLMNLVGELIVGRNQLQGRLTAFNALQRELESAKNRLLDVVAEFQEKYEYSPAGGGLAASAAAGHGASPLARPVSTAARTSQAHAEAAAPAGFSDLEFDRYDDLNILCRALVEIGDDANEVITQSGKFMGAFNDESDRFSKTASRLQETITAVRLSPLESLFRRLGRVAAGVAGQEGKQINWFTEGGATKLDRVVIDQVFQPLLHMVRNAVSHGIEDPTLRAARGKPRQGSVTIRAAQRSGQVVIELEDDGGGMDIEAIRTRATERGFIPPGVEVEEVKLINLVFQPGFSTAKTVTDISGRGIGMDVVRREITRLNGSIEIRSRAGLGTTIALRLPLTLAINQAAFIGVGTETYALAANFLERAVTVRKDHIYHREDGLEMLPLGDRDVPFLRLDRLLEAPPIPNATPTEDQQAVVVQLADEQFALGIDRNIGRQDVVVKALGPILAGHSLFSGGTIGTDGRAILVLDLPGISDQLFRRTGQVEALYTPVSVVAETEDATTIAPGGAPGFDPRALAPILIVDDSLSIRKVAEKYVGELGYRTDTAADGLAALDKIKRNTYSLVMTDLEMPRMHGFDLLAAIRKNEATRDLPVLVVTSRTAEKHRFQARELGANDYVTKPFSKEQLGEKFERFLKMPALQA